jgi:hypothetical protein
MYTPTDLVNKPWKSIQEDIETIARNYGPCDVVLADIEAGTPEERVLEFVKTCAKISGMR